MTETIMGSGPTMGGTVEQVLTVPEAAAFLRVNVKTLYKMIEAGQVPHVRMTERRIRLRRSTLVAWMEGQESDSRKLSRR